MIFLPPEPTPQPSVSVDQKAFVIVIILLIGVFVLLIERIVFWVRRFTIYRNNIQDVAELYPLRT